MRRTGVGSRGKGGRRRPWRDGGARRATHRAVSWREYVPNALRLESAVATPTAEIRFNVWTSALATDLGALDRALRTADIPYYIQLLKRSAGGVFQMTRFRLIVSTTDTDVMKEILREAGIR